jgi:hypothetical protein
VTHAGNRSGTGRDQASIFWRLRGSSAEAGSVMWLAQSMRIDDELWVPTKPKP